MVDPTNNPKAWENYFKDIVRLHYKPANYRDVPDKHVGDFGVECYSLSGHVFQCYLPEQVADVAKLVKAQRGKINKDINKFVRTNVNDLSKLFGEIKISRWILATNVNDSAVLAQFCSQKSIKVRNLGLSYIADDFEILVHTDKDYPVEAASLKRDSYQLQLKFSPTSVDGAANWIDDNLEFLAKLDMKLPKIHPEKDKVDQIKNYLVQKYLDYQNMMDMLRSEWSDIYEIVYSCIQYRESSLVERFLLEAHDTLPSVVIKEEISKLHSNITEEIKSFKATDLEQIKWGVITDWLIRCPLDF